MPSTLSVKSLLVVGFHTHTHPQTHYMQLMSVYWSLHQKINNEVTYIYPDSITLVGQRWQWAAGRRRFVTVGPPVAH